LHQVGTGSRRSLSFAEELGDILGIGGLPIHRICSDKIKEQRSNCSQRHFQHDRVVG
jgi:hypothetical protein